MKDTEILTKLNEINGNLNIYNNMMKEISSSEHLYSDEDKLQTLLQVTDYLNATKKQIENLLEYIEYSDNETLTEKRRDIETKLSHILRKNICEEFKDHPQIQKIINNQIIDEYYNALKRLNSHLIILENSFNQKNIKDIYNVTVNEYCYFYQLNENYKNILVYDTKGKLEMYQKVIESNFTTLYNNLELLWPNNIPMPSDTLGHLKRTYTFYK